MPEQQFETAARRWQRRIFTFAAYFLGNVADAEEVTQDVLLRLWEQPRMWNADRTEAWLMRITRNRCIDRYRAATSESRIVDRLREPATLGRRPDDRPDPERCAVASQLRRRIAVAVSLLPEPQRSVVILREIQGLSYREIADACDISLASVKVSLHRGRRRLRERLEEVHDHVVAV